jgi:phospholipid/cholesterol/gamma-HCH transport system substrate-binding protein
MDGAKAEFKVGLTVLVALAILVGGLFWLKGFRLHESRYRVDVWFPNVGSLGVGDPVSVSGVSKGKVADIDLAEGGVRVGLYFANDVTLHADADFTIMNIGLMGERFVDVKTGVASDSLRRQPMPRGVYETGIPEVMGLMGRMTEDVRGLISAVRSTIGSDSALAQLTQISHSLESITRETAGMVTEHRATVAQAINDLGAATASMRQTVESNAHRVSETFERFDTAAVRLTQFAANLDSLAGNVHAVVDELQHGNGTLPRLIHDDQLLRRWESTAEELDLLITDMRAHPGKYLKVKISLF